MANRTYEYSIIKSIKWLLSICIKHPKSTLRALDQFKSQHRIGRCECCNKFTILYNAPIAYSEQRAFLCSYHAGQESIETELAWRDYYSGLL